MVIAGFSAAAGLAGPASAQMSMSSAYIGASLGQSKLKDSDFLCAGATSCDTKDSAWKIFGGYQFNQNLAVELGYTNLGEASSSLTAGGFTGGVVAETTAWELVGVGSFPIANQFSIYGKLGFYRGETDLEGTGILAGLGTSESNTDLTYGLGVRYDFSRNIGVRAEWQRYTDVTADTGGGTSEKSDVDVLSVGVIWRF